jgi:hypothetical protein
MKLEENRPHGFQVSSSQAKAWVVLLLFFFFFFFFFFFNFLFFWILSFSFLALLDLSNRPHALLLRIELHTVNYTADNEQETNPAQIMSESRFRSFRQAVQLKQAGQSTAAIQ